MHTTVRKLLCFSLALVFSSTTIIAKAQRTAAVIPVPPPPQISAAHTIFITNGGAPTAFTDYTGGANRLYNSFYSAIEQWSHYQIVNSPTQADLIFEITGHASSSSYVGTDNLPYSVYQHALVLRVIDPKANAVIWTMAANIQPKGLQGTRDKRFDAATIVLINQLRQLNGEQLTPNEMKDINNSNHAFFNKKGIILLLLVGIGASAGLLAYGLSHRPSQQSCLRTFAASKHVHS
jgi:hypothetical protein